MNFSLGHPLLITVPLGSTWVSDFIKIIFNIFLLRVEAKNNYVFDDSSDLILNCIT